MNSQEFIRERKSYKVGYCIKLNRTFSAVFPPAEIYTIIGLTSNNNGEICYIIDRDAPNNDDRIFHYSYVFRDDECKRMERKKKLDAIKKR